MRGKGVTRALYQTAWRQHSVIARRQLRANGLSDDQVDRLIASGRLWPVHRGVYLVSGARQSREGIWMAAALALGSTAVVSHRSAAQLWTMLPGCSSPVHVTVPTGGRKPREGVTVHRSGLEGEVTRKRGIPVTKPARTLVDLASQVDRRTLERAADEAERLRLTTHGQLHAALARRPGAAQLRALLEEHVLGSTATANDFEELMIGICDDFGIPRPRCQFQIGPYRVDFAWPHRKLAVEADSWESHGTRRAFEDDPRRTAGLRAMGWETLRFTWRQMTHQRAWVADNLCR